MNKDVLATTIPLYETKPFLDVEPFDRTKTFLGRSCTSLPVTHGLTKFVWSLMGQDAGQPLDAGSEGRAKAPPKLAPVSSLRFFADDDLIQLEAGCIHEMGILYLQMSAANVLPLGVDHDDLWLCAGEHQRQDLAAQDAELASACCAKVFREKGAKTDRPELAKLIRRLDRGDVLMVAPRSARALNP